jgi:hypothetical protein
MYLLPDSLALPTLSVNCRREGDKGGQYMKPGEETWV